MPVRKSIALSERHKKFISEQIENGNYPSKSALVAEAVEQLILSQHSGAKIVDSGVKQSLDQLPNELVNS
jgi:Arc/MetJ-type ribon-helix-helix transcriptional regulator